MPKLVDKFGRRIEYLRLSVTDRCDFRCYYCIPRGFKDFADIDKRLTADEIIRLVRLFSRMGVSKVRLTGGEPLVRGDIVDLVSEINRLSGVDDISMSTNASQLARYAGPLKQAGLSRINVSLDSLKPDLFREITQGNLDSVINGLMAAREVGFHPIKINMVVIRQRNLSEVADMVDFCLKHRFTLRFIETMPIGASGQGMLDDFVSMHEIVSIIEQRFALEPARMTGAGPARYMKVVGGRLKFGFITPMSQHFCADCNRVRLTAEGTLYLCLGQHDKVELRELIRDGISDRDLEQVIRDAIDHKPEKHEFNTKPDQVVRIMSVTGG